MKNKKTWMKRIIILFISVLALNIILVGCDEKTINYPPYTEELKEEADLVDVEGFVFSELDNTARNRTYYRFKINQGNKDSVDIEVTDIDCFPTYAENTNVDYKDKLGKVYMYERTYNISDTETLKRNIYKVYVLKDKVKTVSMDS
jgi:hypothetical protein